MCDGLLFEAIARIRSAELTGPVDRQTAVAAPDRPSDGLGRLGRDLALLGLSIVGYLIADTVLLTF